MTTGATGGAPLPCIRPSSLAPIKEGKRLQTKTLLNSIAKALSGSADSNGSGNLLDPTLGPSEISQLSIETARAAAEIGTCPKTKQTST